MSREQIEEGNTTIAKFMSGKYQPELNAKWKFVIQPTEYYRSDARHVTLNYHKDWNWLMPVVEKIKNMDKIVSINLMDEETNVQIRHSAVELIAPINMNDEDPITALWFAILEFIHWYNTNNKTA